jgi:hypothetical protein
VFHSLRFGRVQVGVLEELNHNISFPKAVVTTESQTTYRRPVPAAIVRDCMG